MPLKLLPALSLPSWSRENQVYFKNEIGVMTNEMVSHMIRVIRSLKGIRSGLIVQGCIQPMTEGITW